MPTIPLELKRIASSNRRSKMTSVRPPMPPVDDRFRRAFPEQAEKLDAFGEELIRWWQRVSVYSDSGSSTSTSDTSSTSTSSSSTTDGSTVPSILQNGGAGSGSADSATYEDTTPADLIRWTEGEQYTIVSATHNSKGQLQSATIRWPSPDGTFGTFKALSHNSVHLTIDSYDITHPASGRRLHQPKVTRDSGGNVASKPNIVIHPI